MVDTTILLHANLLYAEFPFAEIPNVVDRSYLPVLEMLEKNPQYRIVLNVSGFTLDVLSGAFPEYGKYPEVIDLIKTLVKRGQVELTGTSWTHAILPLMTTEDVERDIGRYLDTAKRVLGVRPVGFFPPELSIDPLLPAILSERGFKWCIVDSGLRALHDRRPAQRRQRFQAGPPLPLQGDRARVAYGPDQAAVALDEDEKDDQVHDEPGPSGLGRRRGGLAGGVSELSALEQLHACPASGEWRS